MRPLSRNEKIIGGVVGIIVVVVILVAIFSSSGEVTQIYVQADEFVTVFVNGKEVGKPHAGWPTLGTIETKTKPGDIIKFTVRNTGSAGGLRATIVRKNMIINSGVGIKVVDGETIDVVNTEWKWAVDGAWAVLKDVPLAHKASKWIWNKNMCMDCTVAFEATIP